MPSALAGAIRNNAVGLAADWALARIGEEVSERTGKTDAALDHVEADLSALERTATLYRQAYVSAKLHLASIDQTNPDTENALVACSQFQRLPEMAEINKAIDALHRVGAYSESLADDIVQRIRADMKGEQRRMERQLANQRKAKQPRGSNGKTLPGRRARNLAVGSSKKIADMKDDRILVEHTAENMKRRVAAAVGDLKTTLRDMQETHSRFIHLDRHICREFRSSVGGGW